MCLHSNKHAIIEEEKIVLSHNRRVLYQLVDTLFTLL